MVFEALFCNWREKLSAIRAPPPASRSGQICIAVAMIAGFVCVKLGICDVFAKFWVYAF